MTAIDRKCPPWTIARRAKRRIPLVPPLAPQNGKTINAYLPIYGTAERDFLV